MEGVEKSNSLLIPAEIIEPKILLIRGQKVILDHDLATLYCVTTGNLNKSVNRNLSRFPSDFMFRLNKEEYKSLIFHFGISKHNYEKRGGRRYMPYVFTEQGIAMLSTVLSSERAIQVNIVIMRTFIKLRQIVSVHKDLSFKLAELERKVDHNSEDIIAIFNAIRKMIKEEEKPKRRIGFI